MSESPQHRSALSLVTKGYFARMWWASVVSSTGDWITIFATIAVADDIAGGTGTLVAIFSRILPGLLFGAAVGVITDRVDRRRLLVISDVGRALLVPLLIFADNLLILVSINFGLELLSLLGQSPRAAIVPRLVKEANIVAGNSLILGATYGTIPVGAAFNWFLAALPAVSLWGLVPPGNEHFALAFIVDGLTFVMSASLVATLPVLRTEAAQRRIENHEAEDTGLAASLIDLRDGVVFLWSQKSVRRIIVSLTTSLFGGGVIIVIGKPFVEDVLGADAVGFFAVVTTAGLGAGLGILFVSMYAARLGQRDLVFGVAAMATGVGLGAAALTSTVFGASAWMLVMGFGAGAAYVMGFSYLHEEVEDELRGRVFAAVFGLMRIGIFVSMAIAVPVESLLRRVDLGVISRYPTRSILIAGGFTIVLSGLAVVWSLRGSLLRPQMDAGTRQMLEEASKAARSKRRSGPDA